MKKEAVALIALCLNLLLLQVYRIADQHLNGPERHLHTIADLQKKLAEEQLARTLAEYAMLEFKVEVAALMPQTLKKNPGEERGYPLRNLASVVSSPQAEKFRNQIVDEHFQKGKKLFREQQYEAAIEKFSVVVRKYSFSVHVPEAYFLIVESQFLLGSYEDCVRTVQDMLRLLPENELTGYALLRTGKIYELQSRTDDAIGVYRTVLRSFPYRGVALQAQQSMGAIEL